MAWGNVSKGIARWVGVEYAFTGGEESGSLIPLPLQCGGGFYSPMKVPLGTST